MSKQTEKASFHEQKDANALLGELLQFEELISQLHNLRCRWAILK